MDLPLRVCLKINFEHLSGWRIGFNFYLHLWLSQQVGCIYTESILSMVLITFNILVSWKIFSTKLVEGNSVNVMAVML